MLCVVAQEVLANEILFFAVIAKRTPCLDANG